MTTIREFRTTIALVLAILMVLIAFVWTSQPRAHASLATEILCLVDQIGDEQDGDSGPFAVFDKEECEDQGGIVVDWCPNLPGDQASIDMCIPADVDMCPNIPGMQTDADLPCTAPPAEPQCNDGDDNDSDQKTDFPADLGCSSSEDDTESPDPVVPPAPACSDGQDNDADDKTDFPADPGCADAQDADESDPVDTSAKAQCEDGVDNDNDGNVDYPSDDGCESLADDQEEQERRSRGGGGSIRRASVVPIGEVLGAATGECPMYLTGYMRQGAANDAGEVARLQVFLNAFEGNALSVSGVYDGPTVAAVNAFQSKYAAEVLTPWGLLGPSGYVYYTTQKQINTIFCKFQKSFPLTANQQAEIAQVRAVRPQASATAPARAAASTNPARVVPAVGTVVLPNTNVDENRSSATTSSRVQGAASTNASTTKGWFGNFVDWLFGR